MAFPTQFSLSLETTQLIPMAMSLAGKTYEAALSLARDLQNSGSDIIVEADLADLFGRLIVVSNIESSFKETMAKPTGMTPWHNEVYLYSGAGPTVIRALSETQYLSTIIQCSFLITEHEPATLATVIVQHLNKNAEDAPQSNRRAAPSSHAVHRTLRACEDQTERYQWRRHLLAAAALLGLSEDSIHETIASAVLRGLLLMMPRTQRFPEDELIHIKTTQGICNIVVWAHTILGLKVKVLLNDETGLTRVVRFPLGNIDETEQVSLDARKDHSRLAISSHNKALETFIILLRKSSQENLFELKADVDDVAIVPTVKGPARGLAARVLKKAVPHGKDRARVIKELGIIAGAFGLRMAAYLHRTVPHERSETPSEEGSTQGDELDLLLPHAMPADRVIDAWEMLFDAPLDAGQTIKMQQYVDKYAGISMDEIQRPEAVINILDGWNREKNSLAESDSCWPELRRVLHQISILMLAIAHIEDLKACVDAPLCEQLSVLATTDIYLLVWFWDGTVPIPVREDVWLEVLALVLARKLGDRTDLERTSMLSNRGWSLCITTFGDDDPYYLSPASIAVMRGTPWRNGVWWHTIKDGPQAFGEGQGLRRIASAGETIKDSCTSRVSYGKSLVGERGDDLLITLRLVSQHLRIGHDSEAEKDNHRTGYSELWSALWMTEKCKPCTHSRRDINSLVLEPGWCAMERFGQDDRRPRCELGTLRICLTAQSIPARWLALLTINRFQENGTLIMLRGPDCCVRCAAREAAAQDGIVYLVL